MRCLYTSDLHGHHGLYDRLFRLAREEAAGAILLGGDLSPLTPPLDVMIENQRVFWSEFLAPACRTLRAEGRRVLLIPGNDDLAIHDPLLAEGHDAGLWDLVDGTSEPLGGLRVVGCSLVSPTPFALKDRERWDVEPGVLAAPDGIPLDDAGRTIRSVDRPAPSTTLWRELDRLLDSIPEGVPVALMAHCPPAGTALDVCHDGRHVGSEAVRRVLEHYRPRVGLQGHIHESPDMAGGSWRDAIGDTIVVNGGSTYHRGEDAHLQVVSFDTDDVAGTIDWRRLPLDAPST